MECPRMGAAVEMSIVIPFKMTINHTTTVGFRGDAASGQIAWERKNEWMNQRGPSKLMLPSPRNPTGRLIVYILLTCQWHASNIFISLIMADSHYRSIINISCQEQSAINYLYKLVRKQALVYHPLARCRFSTFRHQTWTWTWTAGNYCAHTTQLVLIIDSDYLFLELLSALMSFEWVNVED